MKIRFTLSIGYANAKQEEIIDIDNEEWYSCENQEQKDNLMHYYWVNWSNNFIDGGAEVVT